MTYAGLTIADKPALEDAKARGKKTLTMAFSDRVQVVNIAIAISQIAKMEKARKPMTWNEHINHMTVDEKAREFLFANAQDHVFKGTPLEGKFCYIALNGGYYETSEKAIAASEKFLRSPYTEGDTDEG